MQTVTTTKKAFSCKDFCRHYLVCAEPCEAVDILANNKGASKEKIINYNDNFLTKDYKEVLCRMQASKEFLLAKNIEQIREMPDFTDRELRRKAIAAMLCADISAQQISRVVRRSIRRVYQMIITKPKIKK